MIVNIEHEPENSKNDELKKELCRERNNISPTNKNRSIDAFYIYKLTNMQLTSFECHCHQNPFSAKINLENLTVKA